MPILINCKLKGYLVNINTKIEAEVERLAQSKNRIEKRIEQVKSPTQEMIFEAVKESESKLEELMHEENDLLAKKNEKFLPAASSSQALEDALNALSEAELVEEFIPQCKKSFPGIHFDEIEAKQNKAMYVKMQIQKTIASDTLPK